MEDGVKFHGLPLWQQIKDVLFVDEKDRFVLAIIRGDFDVNEVKLKNLIKEKTVSPIEPREDKKEIPTPTPIPGVISVPTPIPGVN